ncbi:hypothetical protein [Halospina sp. K52047b]|uniref:hypothetical protein n=1 Tax=Halospina sp. K52047b TaxID=2614160 RepID=UPI001249EA3F|nr:hypothetical protein [Halospina sp. K52047b]KAA8983014.1 hypothetical protein F3089_07780 [Halospina sp. K52047b]
MGRWLVASGVALAVLLAVIAGLYAVTTAMPESAPEPVAVTQPPEPSPSSVPEPGGSAEPESGSPVARRLEGEFARIADQYEAGSRYPPYSFPIDEQAVSDYRYNGYSPVRVPVATDDGERATISLSLDRLHFEHGEPITGQVSVGGNGASGISLDEVTLRNEAGDILHRESLEAGSGAQRLSVSPGTSSVEEWPMELMLMVSGDFRGEPVDAVAPLRYHAPVGDIIGVGASRVEGAHLVIPVEVAVETSGDYAIAGNLYTESGKPLVHVEHETRLSSLEDTAELRIHRQALEAKGDEGPYQLGDLSLRQLPARPGDRTRFGPTGEERHDVEGAPFERYSQEDYQDPMREARLEFLRNAAEEIEP